MSQSRPEIPQAIKREVRRRCFFGCVICGMPIFHYDHIVDYASDPKHEADNITLLCPNHHQDKTSGRLKRARVEHWNAKPFNSTRKATTAYKLEPSESLTIMVGSTLTMVNFNGEAGLHRALWVNGKDFLGIHYDDGWLSISADITDARGKKVIKIREGEVTLATDVADYRYEGSRLRIFDTQHRVTVIDLTLTSEIVHVRRGLFIDHQDGSGYAVVDNHLRVIKEGRDMNFTYSDLISSGNDGGLAILNRKFASEADLRGGWAFINRF